MEVNMITLLTMTAKIARVACIANGIHLANRASLVLEARVGAEMESFVQRVMQESTTFRIKMIARNVKSGATGCHIMVWTVVERVMDLLEEGALPYVMLVLQGIKMSMVMIAR